MSLGPRASATIRGIRIAVPWILAVIAPLVMAGRHASAYEGMWDTLPWITKVMIKYGLFMSSHLWLAVLVSVVLLGGFQLVAHHPRLQDTVQRAFMALHLSGVLVALLVIFSFFLPRLGGST